MSTRSMRVPLVVLATALTGAAAVVVPPAAGPAEDPAEPRYAQTPGDGLAPRVPNAYFFAERAYPHDKIPLRQWQATIDRVSAERAVAAVGGPQWTPKGPLRIGGRITCVAVHPSNADIVYVGAAEGGVLKTTNAGASWTPLFDDQPTLSIGAIALDPSDPNTIYAGTGEVNPGGGSVAYGGAGIFRSTDGGANWTCIGLENSGSIGRIRVDPNDPDRIFVGAMGHLWTTSTDRGVYRTTDGGATWELVHYTGDETGCVDLIMRPDDPDVVYAAMWERLRQPEFYDYGGSTCAVYRTVDGGDTWSLVGGGLPAPSADGGRIGLSLCAGQPDVMHAIYADRTGFFDGLFRSTDGGFNWTQTNDGALSSVYSSYGWWFGNVRTHPVDPDTIFVLGLSFYRSTNGGASYASASGGMHVDHHGLAFGPGASPVIYEGNDGGMYRSINGGTQWSKLFDLPITQAYRIALDANNPNAIYIGTQDNGTVRTQTGDPDQWFGIYGGDGFQALVHPTNSNRIWVQFQYGNLAYSSNGGGGWSGAGGGISGSDRRNWNSPLVQDPTDEDVRYFGTNKLYRSASSTSWTAISGDLTDGPHAGNAGQVNGTLTTIGVSAIDGDVIWTGSDDGNVHVTDDGGATWSDVSAGLPVRWITSVRADPFNVDGAYLTISGFRWGEPLPRVYHTSDLGASWAPIAGNLPDAPVQEVLPDPDRPDRLFAATDVGVYETTDGGASWALFGNGLPNVVVTTLALDRPNQLLYAGTYGRSTFSIEIDTPCPWDLSGDGSVTTDDLLVLLAAWGFNPGHPADFDGDGNVAVPDLLAMIAAWGNCP